LNSGGSPCPALGLRAETGGIFIAASGSLALKGSTVLGNSAPPGADMYNLGALTMDDSTVAT